MFRVTYFWWNTTTGSSKRSLQSIKFPFLITSGCFFIISQPTWEKKKPLFALCGSASVSENLWCTRWSRTQSNKEFWKYIRNQKFKFFLLLLILLDQTLKKMWWEECVKVALLYMICDSKDDERLLLHPNLLLHHR